ncbi:hypothetical protein [Achromobacter deleyi]|uniref:hypothetical protein n=1 Tax=Achromobacter deleyi TaxID=1353891 RepID=UPI0014919BAF|nr:hypothetical protein [Achromobacter deleyi]QVQ29525.1 hypothetical protein HLG70_14465 [Achromobacter deleyi]UIP19648.1 hypothetical protein LYZ39_22075 [Achromobacter deleyi]
MSIDQALFNRITFALPVQPFKVTAFISTEERLPAVTEFVLRLLHTCGQVSLAAFRQYFGFSEAEALAVVETLDRQGYVTLTEDELTLSEDMRQRFEASPDNYPWVSKLKRRTDVVFFDLLSFSVLGRADFAFATANWVKLNPPPGMLGNSIEQARRAYRESFVRIERATARARGEERERSYGVHSIESIDARKPGYIPLTVSLEVDAKNTVTVKLPHEFEAGASLDLLSEFREGVAATLEAGTHNGEDGLQNFLDMFGLDFLRPYAPAAELNAHKLAVDIERGLDAPAGIQPMFGSLYLQRNRNVVLDQIHEARVSRRGKPVFLSSLSWLAPNYALWGRGEDFKQSVESFRKAIRNTGKGDDLFIFDRADERQEHSVRSKFAGTGLVELHLLRHQPPSSKSWQDCLELILYPGRFAVVMFHATSPSTPGACLPFGFLSTQPKHLRMVHQLMVDSGDGKYYGGRWAPSRDGTPKRMQSLFEACTSLAYSDIQLSSTS